MVVVTVIDIVFVLAAAAVVETHVVVVVVPSSDVIPRPPLVPGLTIEKVDVHWRLVPGFRHGPLPDPGVTPAPCVQEDLCQG